LEQALAELAREKARDCVAEAARDGLGRELSL